MASGRSVQYFTQVSTCPLILEVTPNQLHRLTSLNGLYVTSIMSGAAVPLSAFVTIGTDITGLLSIIHQGQFRAVNLSFNLRSGVSLGQALTAIRHPTRGIQTPKSMTGTFTGNVDAFRKSLASTPFMVLLSLLAVYIVLGIL